MLGISKAKDYTVWFVFSDYNVQINFVSTAGICKFSLTTMVPIMLETLSHTVVFKGFTFMGAAILKVMHSRLPRSRPSTNILPCVHPPSFSRSSLSNVPVGRVTHSSLPTTIPYPYSSLFT